MRNCEWCKAEFKPTNEEQAYCKPLHAKKAQQKRKKAKDALATAGKCPTPYKRGWNSVEHAAAWKLPTTQYLYTCPCGAIHAATYKDKRTVKAAA